MAPFRESSVMRRVSDAPLSLLFMLIYLVLIFFLFFFRGCSAGCSAGCGVMGI